MADGLCTTASAMESLETASALTNEIEEAKQQIKGSSKVLISIHERQSMLSQCLKQLRGEPHIHTPEVVQQINSINNIQKEILVFLSKIHSQESDGIVKRYYSLNAGDEDDRQLGQILDRLHDARKDLDRHLSRLRGKSIDRVVVTRGILMETNEDVKKMSGRNLALADNVQNRQLQRTDRAFVSHDEADMRDLGYVSREESQPRSSKPASSVISTGPPHSDKNLDWQRNKTEGDPSLWVGNIGYDAVEQVSAPNARVKDNTFGQGLRFVVGHVAQSGADAFMQSFFKR